MSELIGSRVFLVEDETGVAMLIEDMLEELGCELVASVAHLAQAFDVVASTVFDVAILDVNVSGEQVFPLASTLATRGIPIVFSTGYGMAGIPEEMRVYPVLAKPFAFDELKRTLVSVLREAPDARRRSV
ncbi:response regulator [Bordetella flabilis]|nr:response regulator [Bordetella flabilis]